MRKVLVIGAGPAGLVAAYQLIQKSDIKPIIIEECDQVGGLSKTVNCAGNRMDLGGHRFFSKSERVNKLWQSILMPENDLGQGDFLTRKRVSRIFFLGKFFDYPVALNKNTILTLGTSPTNVMSVQVNSLVPHTTKCNNLSTIQINDTPIQYNSICALSPSIFATAYYSQTTGCCVRICTIENSTITY